MPGLGRQALLFPLCLVLYEFSTYIGNDMIQPGMLAVVEQYQAGIDWVPYFNDRISGGQDVYNAQGRRIVLVYPVMLAGSGVILCHLSGNITGAKH